MRLAVKVMAGVTALAAFTSSEAQAADYLIYSFNFTGTETRISNTLPTTKSAFPGNSNTMAVQGSIVYYLPTSFANASLFFTNVSSSYMAPDYINGAALGNLFNLNETLTGPYRAPSRNVSISACLAGGIPGASISINPSCSTVRFSNALSLGMMGGDLTTITGTLTGMTITDGYGPAKFGLASYPQISVSAAPTPELATWTMMILGIGAIGFALRRQKVTTRASYAV